MTFVLSPNPRRILVVGGGPCGLVSLRNLIDSGQFDEVVLAERRDDVGGVWYLEDVPKSTPPRNRPFWPSPAYPGLVGNVLSEYLSFSHHPFPAPDSKVHPYPTLAETHAYLRRFASPYIASGQIRLSTEVLSVDELPGARGWSVTTRDWRKGKDGEVSVEIWDAVVVATAWYDHPSWPESTPGLAEARAAGLATHAQIWYGPDGYKGKRVVVVGNANSANDIVCQLVTVAGAPVYRSIRRQGLRRFAFLPDSRVIDVPPITRYTVNSERKLDLQFHDGSTLTDIDTVVLGTGYSAAAAPFVRVLQPPSPSTALQKLTPLTSTHTVPARIPALYQHILYAHAPTLAFIGTVMSYTPFTLADVASTWLTLVFSGQLAIPDTIEARLQGERERLAKRYAQGLKDAIVAVATKYQTLLPEWSDTEWKRREAMYERKWVSLMATRDAELEEKQSAGSISRL
ncbi:hypothetical protein B0H10DRAFT_2164370 [Mycena sp. CBHHK59/15]|nr:hypothetical protein B0H10DRAFT_2164370 [Mycena sp. CBHHK59/15]